MSNQTIQEFFKDKEAKTIKHNQNGPFIPYNIIKTKVKKYICKKNLKKFGINKDQLVAFSTSDLNTVVFEINKKTRIVSLPTKMMKYFKEVKE